MKNKDSLFVPIIYTLSIIVPIVVALLMYLPERYELIGTRVDSLPFFHAVLNGSTAVLLVLALIQVKNKNYSAHKKATIIAFILSSIFLVSYVISKIEHPPTPYQGEGFMRYLYFFILISHIVLSMFVIPLALFSLYRGLTDDREKHKKISKWTFPIWLYVAITGVLVYVFMIPYY